MGKIEGLNNGIYETEGLDAGRIKDSEVAHELANLEKPARDRELELEEQAPTTLSKEEKFNLRMIHLYHEKYPNVPIEADNRGEPFIYVRQSKIHGEPANAVLVIHRRGMYSVHHADQLHSIKKWHMNKKALVDELVDKQNWLGLDKYFKTKYIEPSKVVSGMENDIMRTYRENEGNELEAMNIDITSKEAPAWPEIVKRSLELGEIYLD